MTKTVAVLGTGIIGAPVARNLSKAGFAVRAWNRTAAKAEALSEDGVEVEASATEAAAGAPVVITVLTDGPAVLEAIRAAAPAAGTIWVQLSTVGDAVDELVAYADEHGLVFVDARCRAPVSPPSWAS